MSDAKDRPKPETNPSDERVKRVRDRTMDLLADAAVNVQRIERVAEKLGLTADLVDGVGDYLYDAVAAQLDLASKIVERSQVVADRILAVTTHSNRSAPKLLRLAVMHGEVARVETLVTNATEHSADVGVKVEFVGAGASVSKIAIGRPRLLPGQETYVEVSVDTGTLKAGDVHVGTVRTSVKHRAETTELAPQDFEIWVRA